MTFQWDKYKTGDQFKFDVPPKTLAGILLNIGEFKGINGDTVPTLSVNTTEGPRSVICGQAVLISRLAEAAPQIGDHIEITYTGDDVANKKPGQNAAKLFDVKVTPKTLLNNGSLPVTPDSPQTTAGAAQPF